MRPRESAKQAVWALVFVSVAAGATLPSTHLSCRPAGPRHNGCGRRGGALSWQEPTLPSLREEKPGEVWGQWGPCPASTYSLLSVRPNNKREKKRKCAADSTIRSALPSLSLRCVQVGGATCSCPSFQILEPSGL